MLKGYSTQACVYVAPHLTCSQTHCNEGISHLLGAVKSDQQRRFVYSAQLHVLESFVSADYID
jgi:hypothetical protein